MTIQVITGGEMLVGSLALSQFTGMITYAGECAMKQAPFHGGGGYMRVLPGLKKYTQDATGYADFATGGVSVALNHSSPGTQTPVAIFPDNQGASTAGLPASFTRSLIARFAGNGGPTGEVATFELSTVSDTAEVEGVVAAPLAAYTVTVNGAVQAITGPTAGKSLYAALFVTAVSGTTPSLTAVVQSATLVGFGSPTTRGTFTAMTATGAQWLTPVAGPITDGFYRVNFTISGTTPSFTACAVIGVL
jgi:hypothetical protein